MTKSRHTKATQNAGRIVHLARIELMRTGADNRAGNHAWLHGDRVGAIRARILAASSIEHGSDDPDGFVQRWLRTVPGRMNARAVAGAGLMCMPLASPAVPLHGTRASAATWAGASFAQAGLMVDGLHRRLGEIRYVMPADDIGGDLFARYVGGRFDRMAGPGERDARMHAGAWQSGAGLAYWNEAGDSHRAGWALERGALRVRSKGTAPADDEMTGVAAWYTHQRDNGLYLDVVLRRAGHVARMDGGSASIATSRARQWTYSFEAGAPLPLGESMAIEPQLQLRHQSLHARKVMHLRQTAARIGARLARIDNERFVPYARIDLERQSGGRGRIAGTVRGGTSVSLSAGFTIKLHRTVDVYADAGLQRRLAGGGGTGGSVSAGVRINF